MTLVIDASMVVAGLTGNGVDGRWAESLLAGDALAAPHLMPVVAANILRRAALAGDISADVASLAHADLLDLRVEFFPCQPCATRVWELRENVTCHDGWYVAVAETARLSRVGYWPALIDEFLAWADPADPAASPRRW